MIPHLLDKRFVLVMLVTIGVSLCVSYPTIFHVGFDLCKIVAGMMPTHLLSSQLWANWSQGTEHLTSIWWRAYESFPHRFLDSGSPVILKKKCILAPCYHITVASMVFH